MSTVLRLILPLLLSLTLSALARADILDRPGVQEFIDEMAGPPGFERKALEELFRNTEMRDDIIAAISRPAEGKPWHQYRPLFLTETRIREGVTFWNQNAAALAAAEKTYGVPAAIIVAIIGVETRYGQHRGRYRVMDALATLAFGYPQRAPFFRSQLAEYLLMTREEKVEPLSLTGSYAGAMGQPQFMPSSFRAYAVDFDQDGRRDLWENRSDIIGSVANYFAQHKWSSGAPVAFRAESKGGDLEPLLSKGLQPAIAASELAANGISHKAILAPDQLTALLQLESENGPEYWVTLNNFYVITRYNRSPLYAMAVWQLSEAIRATRNEQLAVK
ncbi:MAG TPA: lytic murein transglycosylase B [Gammaproteobacteria bacterium]